MDRQKDPKPRKLPPRCRHAHSFQVLSWKFCPPTPAFFFSSIILFHMFIQAFDTLKIENSRSSLWNLKYSEKGDVPEHFARTFPLFVQFSHESEHIKLMTSRIINLPLAAFYRQSPSIEVIDKSKVPSVPSHVNFNCYFGHAYHFVPFVFESSLRRSYGPFWKLQSCALPSWFQSISHFSKPHPRVLVSESDHPNSSGPFALETLVCTHTPHP